MTYRITTARRVRIREIVARTPDWLLASVMIDGRGEVTARLASISLTTTNA